MCDVTMHVSVWRDQSLLCVINIEGKMVFQYKMVTECTSSIKTTARVIN